MGIRKTTWIEPILFGYMFCKYLMLPAEDQLIYKKCCLHTFNSTLCDNLYTSENVNLTIHQNNLQQQTAQWKIYINIVRSVPAAFMTLVYASWSDYVGRKSVIILPIIGDSILAMSMILNAHYIDAPMYFIFFGVFTASLFGSFTAVLSALFCYVADITDESFRTQRTIILESMIYIGSAASNLIGGQVLRHYGFVAIYSLALFVYLLQIIYWFFVEESRFPKVNERKMSFYQMFSLETFATTLQVLIKRRKGKYRLMIWILFACFFCGVLFFSGFNQVVVLYMLHSPLNFLATQIGYFLGEVMLMKFIGALIINYVLVHRFHINDCLVMMISFITYVGFNISLGFSDNEWKVYTSGIWALGVGVAIAVTRGKLSKIVSADEQGKLFSILSCLEALVVLFSGVTLASIYKATVSKYPSTVFFVLAGVGMVPISLSLFLAKLDKADKEEDTPLLNKQIQEESKDDE